MAGTVTVGVQFRGVNGDYDSGQISVTKQVTQTGVGATSGTIVATTAVTAISKGAITTEGYLFLRNLDTTNFVTFGSTGGLEFKMKAGETAGPMRVTPSASLGIRADTASCNVQIRWESD